MAILMLLSTTTISAQRGTCTSGDDPLQYMYTKVNGTEIQDTSNALAGTINEVSPGAEVKVGSALPYIDWGAVASFSIAVSSDNGEPSITIDNANIASYGDKWEPTIPAAFFTAGAVTTVALTVTPDAAADPLTNECSTPWTYTWTFNTASACIPSNHNAYSTMDGSTWVNHPSATTTIDLYNVPIGTDIALGVDNPKGTIVYNGCGLTDETVESDNLWFTPFTEAGSCTITAVYTNNCGDDVTYTFNLSTGATAGVDIFEKAGFNIYPNPATDILNVKYKGEASLSILNIFGQEVKKTTINQEKAINISALSNGIYLLKISVGNTSTLRKFIKNSLISE